MAATKKLPSGQVEPLGDGTTEYKKIDWVLNNQTSIDERVTTMTASVTEMNARMATMETHNTYTTKSLDRMERLLEKQVETTNKINTRIAVAAAIVLTLGSAITFVINGQLGKLSTFMEQQQESQVKTKDTTK